MKELIKSQTRTETTLSLLAVVGLIVAITLRISSGVGFVHWQGWAYAAIAILLLIGCVPPLVRYALSEKVSVRKVCVISALLLLVLIIAFYSVFYSFANNSSLGGVDRILNLVPVLAAVWAAGMGWFVHFHATQRNHRVANAFSIVMQTRTSAEYQKRLDLVFRYFPHGTELPDKDSLYEAAALQSARRRRAELLLEAETERKTAQLEEVKELIRTLIAVDAMRYLLNYYEFVAVGVSKKEIDEDLLYETVSVTVCSFWKRSKHFISFLHDPKRGNQPLAFSSLKDLVGRWETRIHNDVSEITKP